MSEELEKIEPTKITLMIHGKERELKYDFSAWAKIEKEFGGLKNIEKIQDDITEKPFETLPKLIYFGIKDNEDINEENVLDDYGFNDISMISEKLTMAMLGSLPKSNKKKVNKK